MLYACNSRNGHKREGAPQKGVTQWLHGPCDIGVLQAASRKNLDSPLDGATQERLGLELPKRPQRGNVPSITHSPTLPNSIHSASKLSPSPSMPLSKPLYHSPNAPSLFKHPREGAHCSGQADTTWMPIRTNALNFVAIVSIDTVQLL